MWAMVVKEFRELSRDRRMVAMLVFLPLFLLVIYGYAASFEVASIRTAVVGPAASQVAARLPALFSVDVVEPDLGRDQAIDLLRRGTVTAAIVSGSVPQLLVDGSDLFPAREVVAAAAAAGGLLPAPEILFNPDLKASTVMVPALSGMILIFIGMVATSLGVVRERQAGTFEQLAVMPFRPLDVFVGKIAPYFVIAGIDMTIIVLAGMLVFGVPFNGSVLTFALGVILFLFVTTGMGVLISTVSENQGQAIQLAMMALLPQILLSGLIFPLESMAAGVRWLGYLLPLTYFTQISRGVLLRGAPLDSLLVPLGALALLGTFVFGLSLVRFRRDLAPASGRSRDPLTEA